jgi:hypothetical protein
MYTKNPNDNLATYQMEDIEELLQQHQRRKRVLKAFTIKVSVPPLETTFDHRLSNGEGVPEVMNTRLKSSILKSSKTMQIGENIASSGDPQLLYLKGAEQAFSKKKIGIIQQPFENKKIDFGRFSKNDRSQARKASLFKGPSIEKDGNAQLAMCRSDLESQNLSMCNFKKSKSFNSGQEVTVRSGDSIRNNESANSKEQTQKSIKATVQPSFSKILISDVLEKTVIVLKPVFAENARLDRILNQPHPVRMKDEEGIFLGPRALPRKSSIKEGPGLLTYIPSPKNSNVVFPVIANRKNSLGLQLPISEESHFVQPKERVQNKRKQCCLFF